MPVNGSVFWEPVVADAVVAVGAAESDVAGADVVA